MTTGQQAGLFTGPLYTIYKALSAVVLARELENELGVIVLPVFWVASEDHDWAEVDHAFVTSRDGNVRRLQLDDDPPVPLPMSEHRLGEGVRDVLGELGQVVAAYGHGEEVLRWIRDAYRPGATVAAAFREVMQNVLAPFDGLTTDAADPHLKDASLPTLRRAITTAEWQESALDEHTRALIADGYPAQVPILEGAVNVFYRGAHGRERLYRSSKGFALRDAGDRYSEEELLAEMASHPTRFSPNVLLRPVAESVVFPTLAYVAGPGEIAYLAQARPLFEQAGITPPIVFPRFSVTLVDRAIERTMEKLGLSLEELRAPRHELASGIARREMPASVKRALANLRRALVDDYRELIDASTPIDPTLADGLGALRNAALADVAKAERKITARWKARNQVRLEQLDRVRSQLAPMGQPQERVLNVVPYLARHGVDLLSRIASEMRIEWSR